MSDETQPVEGGHDRLWGWFGLSYASWLTMPRVLMHKMPDEWQARMAELIAEYDATWDTHHLPEPNVVARLKGRLVKWPQWVLDYRHPKREFIDAHRCEPVGGDDG